MIDIQKIDRVMEITDESYDVVRQALIDHDGDVDQAILSILRKRNGNAEEAYAKAEAKHEEKPKDEEKQEHRYGMPTGALASDIIDSIKELWEKGNASSLVIEKEGKTVLHLSLAMSTVGLVIAPVAAIIGLGAALITEYTIKVILDDGKVVNVNEMALTRKSSRQDKEKKEDEE